MSTTRAGYCTVDDVRRVLQETELSFNEGALGENGSQLVVDAIAGLTEFIDSKAKKHWYVTGGLSNDTEGVVPTAAKSRDDEEDLTTHGATVDGADVPEFHLSENSDALLESPPRGHHEYFNEDRYAEPKQNLRLAFGKRHDESVPAYTPIQLARKDVSAVNELMVVNADGGFDDWTGPDYSGGVGNSFRGDDWWVRVNNRGVSQLYLNIHAMDDDLASLSKAVYVDFDYGDSELTMTVRRGVAYLAAADLVVNDEFRTALPDDGQLINVETKSDHWERRGKELLSEHWVEDPGQVVG